MITMGTASYGRFHRLNRLFRGNRRILIMAMDHGIPYGDVYGSNTIERLLEIAKDHVDAVILNKGVIETLDESLLSNFEIIFKMNGITSYATDPYDLAILSDVEDALSFDPAALSYELYIGGSHEHPRLAELSSLIREGQRYQVPVISHIYPNEEGRDPKAISHCIRLGLELGTDIIKTFYFEGMKQQVLRTPRPVIIAGGAKMSEMSQVVDYVERSLGEGAAGIAMGRNLWGWGDGTADLIRRIADMVHSQK